MIEYKAKPYKFLWQFLNKHARSLRPVILGYRSYTALVHQSGTNPPELTVLENSLGIKLEFARAGAGSYFANIDKQIFTADQNNEYVTLSNNSVGVDTLAAISFVGFPQLVLVTTNGGIPADDVLVQTPAILEIRKYF